MRAAQHLHRLREAVDGPQSIEELASRLGDDGFAFLVVLLCLPFLQPIPVGGVSTAIGAYLTVVGIQHATGRRIPWLPGWIARRRLSEKFLLRILGAAERVLSLVERASRPRWSALAARHDLTGGGIALMGIILLIPIPIPLSNFACAVPIVLLALGHIEEDGALTVAGLAAALATAAAHAALFAAGWGAWDWLRS